MPCSKRRTSNKSEKQSTRTALKLVEQQTATTTITKKTATITNAAAAPSSRLAMAAVEISSSQLSTATMGQTDPLALA